MKAIARIVIPAEADKPGSTHEYMLDTNDPNCGLLVAQKVTEAVDTRPDVEGRQAELRRLLDALMKRKSRTIRTPTNAQYPVARENWTPVSRTTGRAIRVELRHGEKHDAPSNNDEPRG